MMTGSKITGVEIEQKVITCRLRKKVQMETKKRKGTEKALKIQKSEARMIHMETKKRKGIKDTDRNEETQGILKSRASQNKREYPGRRMKITTLKKPAKKEPQF